MLTLGVEVGWPRQTAWRVLAEVGADRGRRDIATFVVSQLPPTLLPSPFRHSLGLHASGFREVAANRPDLWGAGEQDSPHLRAFIATSSELGKV